MAAAQAIEYKKPNYDGVQVASDFWKYFYESWVKNPIILQNVIKPYSKINFNGKEFCGEDFIKLLIELASNGLEFADCKYQMIDSGSRQIYIMAIGRCRIGDIISNFSQTFMISYCGKKEERNWTLVNSILML
jgi:hypothetical protein